MAVRFEPKPKSQDCITGSFRTLHDLNLSLCEYVTRLRCDKGVVHQLWEEGSLLATEYCVAESFRDAP
jgi:hypothetical protein